MIWRHSWCLARVWACGQTTVLVVLRVSECHWLAKWLTQLDAWWHGLRRWLGAQHLAARRGMSCVRKWPLRMTVRSVVRSGSVRLNRRAVDLQMRLTHTDTVQQPVEYVLRVRTWKDPFLWLERVEVVQTLLIYMLVIILCESPGAIERLMMN